MTRGPGLAARQAALVAALVADGPAPDGVDGARLAATRRALLRKRASAAASVWPLLAASFGVDWPRVFAEHATGREPVGALRDGWDLARVAQARSALDEPARTELGERETAWHYDGRSAPRRRRLPAIGRTADALLVQVAGATLRFTRRRLPPR